MKKLLAILLALMLVLVNVAALAEPAQEDEGEEEPASTSQVIPLPSQTITITKKYDVQGTTAINPADTLKFVPTSVRVDNATYGVTVPAITIADVTVNTNASEATISIVLPEYKAVGEYIYTITETDTGVAGVTYLANTIWLRVQVLQDPDSANLISGGIKFRLDSLDSKEKIDKFTNTYEAGSLKVSKTVAGNIGDRDKDWNFTVTFTAPDGDKVVGDITATAEGATAPATIAGGWTDSKTATFVLKHGQSVTFSNIPKGVTYTVAEAEANEDDYTTVGDEAGDIAGHEDDVVAYTNTKNVDIDTGIALDSAVYMLIMALALAGFVALKIRRREEN